uniref:Ethylene-responsive nuclear family protein n=1 Tax=Davidia involucrata TaxID=16924 RepID=A0A5B7BL24_DAVIN
MPVPWKKAKFTRVSQLVADHLHPPKRGGSLVVETGFPTSLIDLFVKNRERLKKPSKKKRCEPTTADQVPNFPLRPSNSPSPSNSPTICPSPVFPVSELTNPKCSPPIQSDNCIKISNGIVAREVNNKSIVVVGGDRVEGSSRGEAADANGVLATVLKMSLVVVLALGTKKLAVGITMSAFLLIFLEYFGKYVWKLFKSCKNAQESLKPLIQRVLCFLRIKQDNLIMEEEDNRGLKAPIEQQNGVSSCSNSVEVEGGGLNDPIEEIQIVQPNSILVPPVEEIQRVKDEFEMRGCDKKWGCEELDTKKGMEREDGYGSEDLDTKGVMEGEEDYRGDALKLKNQRSRRAKIKSKIKKLVPKKFRNSKKKGSSSIEDDKVVMCEEQEQEEEGGKSSSFSSNRYDEQDVDDVICSPGELLQPEVEAIIVREEVGGDTERNLERERNSGHVILFLIVLVGLVGGRVFALVLTLSWCLMLKSAGTLRRFMKVPSIRSRVKISS